MVLLWPHMLGLLVAVPVLVAAYLWVLRRRKKGALKYPDAALVRRAIGVGQRVRRHLPPALMLAALAMGAFAVSRPAAVVTLPSSHRTIILAIDVSLSMSATDVEPNRLAAAQAAAKTFIRELPSDVRVGVVSFAGTASVVQAPTANREHAIAAVDRMQLDRHTAIGSGLILSLATLLPDSGIDLESAVFSGGIAAEDAYGHPRPPPVRQSPDIVPVPPGSLASGAIILLTDGRRTIGPDPIEAAGMAADRGVRVHTVGFGTTEGATVSAEGLSMFMRFDEETLRAISDITLGEYFHASSGEELQRVYQELNTRMVLERKETELTALFAAAAAAVMLVAGTLSLLWSSRLG